MVHPRTSPIKYQSNPKKWPKNRLISLMCNFIVNLCIPPVIAVYLYHPFDYYVPHMAYNTRWQMNCCICCGGPFEPDRKAVRARKIGSQSLDYMEYQVVRDYKDWDVEPGSEVKLVSKPNDLHIVHDKNSIPSVGQFLHGGRMVDIWGDEGLHGYDRAHRDRIPNRTIFKRRWLWARSPDGNRGSVYCAVFWDEPESIDKMRFIRGCIRNCIRRSNHQVGGMFTAKVTPNTNITYPGCKECNDIMTQESTMRHLLAREMVSSDPLVPDGVMYVYDVDSDPGGAGQVRIKSRRREEPSFDARRNSKFSFQATLMYYLHRCISNKPAPADKIQEMHYKELDVFFAYILLEICCLMFERVYGKYGGTAKRTKPAYRYKCAAELYISQLFWLLLSNDVAFGQPEDGTGRGMLMSFPIFHRYFFNGLLKTLVLTHKDAAKAVEISDIIFGDLIFSNNANVVIPAPGKTMSPPAEVIGFMARRVSWFYNRILRRYFSIHLAGLTPPQPPIGAPDNRRRLYLDRILINDMLLTQDELTMLLRMCERAAADDVDSFMNNVGIHAVMEMWGEALRTAPVKVENMLMDWMDKWTLVEYHNIVRFNRQDPMQPRISPQVAESIYLMCCRLWDPRKEDIVEPSNQDELDVLRQAPKCTAAKAALRLEYAGAFRDNGEAPEDSGDSSDDD